MASLISAGVSIAPVMGVYRVHTPEFVQYRQNSLRMRASDSEEVRWVSRIDFSLAMKPGSQ